jgi:hypothetical protein
MLNIRWSISISIQLFKGMLAFPSLNNRHFAQERIIFPDKWIESRNIKSEIKW